MISKKSERGTYFYWSQWSWARSATWRRPLSPTTASDGAKWRNLLVFLVVRCGGLVCRWARSSTWRQRLSPTTASARAPRWWLVTPAGSPPRHAESLPSTSWTPLSSTLPCAQVAWLCFLFGLDNHHRHCLYRRSPSRPPSYLLISCFCCWCVCYNMAIVTREDAMTNAYVIREGAGSIVTAPDQKRVFLMTADHWCSPVTPPWFPHVAVSRQGTAGWL